MNSNMNEKHVDILDLFFYLLRKIWIILLAGLILCVSLSGYKLAKRVKTYDILDSSTKLNADESDTQYQQRVQNINKARGYVDMISRVNEQIENQRQYIADSIFMQIDPENMYQSTAQVSVSLLDNSTEGLENVILSAYERDIKAGNYLDNYADELGVRPEYIKELVSVSSSIPNGSYISVDDSLDSVSILNIYVIGPSSDFCDDVMNLIIEEINNIYIDIDSTVSHHSVSIVGIYQLVRIDDNLRNDQSNETDKINSLQKQIVSYNESLDKLAKELGLSGRADFFEYFELHDEEPINGVPTATSEQFVSISSMIKPSIKYGAIGLIAGVFFATVIYVLKYVWGKKFSTQSQFFSQFSYIRKIGVMKPLNKKSKYYRFLDLKTDDDTTLTSEKNNELIKNYYDNLCHEYNKVLITSVCDTDALKSAVKTLGLKGDFRPDIFNNPEIIKEIKDYDAVVLVEQRDSSLFKLVYNEISILTNCGIEILGAIII